MKRIIITMEITDQEIVEEYVDIHPDLIFQDVVHGYLKEDLGLVGVEIVDLAE